MRITLLLTLALFVPANSYAQLTEGPIGIFEGYYTTGNPEVSEISYNNNDYIITEAGENLEMAALLLTVSDSFSLKATITTEDIGTHMKKGAAGLGILSGLSSTPDTLFYFFEVFSDGTVRTSWKNSIGYSFHGFELNETLPADRHRGELELVWDNNYVEAYYINQDPGESILFDRRKIGFSDTVYAGLNVMSLEAGKYTRGSFTDVDFTLNPDSTAIEDWRIYESLQ